MTTTSTFPQANASPNLRPIRLPHDLTGVADLVELCFAATLDEDGRRFIRQMRRAGSRSGAFSLGGLPPSINGFVWVERGELVGNLNLIPVTVEGRRSYLVANVAVHPDFRRRGIAHQLTQAGIAMAAENRVGRLWLQVDLNNTVAQQIYLDFGFEERARRTVWHSTPGLGEVKLPPSVKVRPAGRGEWQQHKYWLHRLYGPEVRWNLPMNLWQFGAGVWGGLWRLLGEQRTRQWSAFHHGKWIGSLTWQSSYAMADWLWLAGPPEKRSLAILSLIPHAYKVLRAENLLKAGRILAANFPAGDSTEAFEAIGLTEHNTLIWMERAAE